MWGLEAGELASQPGALGSASARSYPASRFTASRPTGVTASEWRGQAGRGQPDGAGWEPVSSSVHRVTSRVSAWQSAGGRRWPRGRESWASLKLPRIPAGAPRMHRGDPLAHSPLPPWVSFLPLVLLSFFSLSWKPFCSCGFYFSPSFPLCSGFYSAFSLSLLPLASLASQPSFF